MTKRVSDCWRGPGARGRPGLPDLLPPLRKANAERLAGPVLCLRWHIIPGFTHHGGREHAATSRQVAGAQLR